MERRVRMSKKRLSDGVKIFLFRWWTAGAICFLVAFGTGYGVSSSPLDLVFMLALVTSLVMIAIFNPVIMMLYDVYRAGRIVNNEYRTQDTYSKILRHVREVFKCYFVVVFEYFIYQSINIVLILLLGLGSESVVLPIEPIVYGLLFSMIYQLVNGISDKIVSIYKGRGQK